MFGYWPQTQLDWQKDWERWKGQVSPSHSLHSPSGTPGEATYGELAGTSCKLASMCTASQSGQASDNSCTTFFLLPTTSCGGKTALITSCMLTIGAPAVHSDADTVSISTSSVGRVGQVALSIRRAFWPCRVFYITRLQVYKL